MPIFLMTALISASDETDEKMPSAESHVTPDSARTKGMSRHTQQLQAFLLSRFTDWEHRPWVESCSQLPASNGK